MSDKFRNNFISIENNGISYANRNGLFFTSTSSEYKIIWNEKVQAHTHVYYALIDMILVYQTKPNTEWISNCK